MSGGEHFFDTHVVLGLLSADATKADRAEDVIALGGTVSVQVLKSGCRTLHTEDMQDGLVVERRLTIRNPFAAR